MLIFFYMYQSEALSLPLMGALIFSWFGDTVLVNPGRFRLYAGILSFFAAHILYMLVYSALVPEINTVLFIAAFMCMLAIVYFFIIRLHIPISYQLPVILYGIAIGLLVVFSLQVFMYHKSIVSILFVVGSIAFFISDAVLAYFNTVKPMTTTPRTVVMIQYIIAQACIVIGYTNM